MILVVRLSQVICSAIGNVCAANITTVYDDCLPPCEGIYADVTKMPSENIDGEYYEDLLRDYNKYKRFNYPLESIFILKHLFKKVHKVK